MNSSPISSPRLTLLSPDDKDRLHQAVLHILEKIGMEVLHPRARELMLAAGGRENSAGRITVTAAMLTSALESAPGSVQIYDREGEPAMDLGGWRSYYGTGSDLWYQLDLQSGERRISVLEDAARAAALAQGLPNLDFVMTAAHASDVEPQRAYLAEVAQLVLNTAKPMIHISMDRRRPGGHVGAGHDRPGRGGGGHPAALHDSLRRARKPPQARPGQPGQDALLRRQEDPPDLLPGPPGRLHRAPDRGRTHRPGAGRGPLRADPAPAREPGGALYPGGGSGRSGPGHHPELLQRPGVSAGLSHRGRDVPLLRAALLRLRRNHRLPDPGRPGRLRVRAADPICPG